MFAAAGASFVIGRLIAKRDARLMQRSPSVQVRSTAVGVPAGVEIR